jgi:hypothetical protein
MDCSFHKGQTARRTVFHGKAINGPNPAQCRLTRPPGRLIVSASLQKAVQRGIAMKRKLTWLAISGAAVLVTGLYFAKSMLATPANAGFKATTIATGTFDEIEVFNDSTKDTLPAGYDGKVWLSLQKTKGKSDLYVQSNTWAAVNPLTGAIASTGWHTHPGHSLIIVTSGTLTEYEGEDCTKHIYTFVAGQPAPTLIDPGHGHMHLIRNEGTTAASTIAVQLVPFDPAKQNRRIDAPAPENCANIN